MKDIEIWKYSKLELAHHHLFLMDVILPGFLEDIVPLDKYQRMTMITSGKTCNKCDIQYYITHGEATMKTDNGNIYDVKKGYALCIKRGITCYWQIKKALKMRYREI